MHFGLKVCTLSHRKWAEPRLTISVYIVTYPMQNMLFLHFHEISAAYTGFRGNNG